MPAPDSCCTLAQKQFTFNSYRKSLTAASLKHVELQYGLPDEDTIKACKADARKKVQEASVYHQRCLKAFFALIEKKDEPYHTHKICCLSYGIEVVFSLLWLAISGASSLNPHAALFQGIANFQDGFPHLGFGFIPKAPDECASILVSSLNSLYIPGVLAFHEAGRPKWEGGFKRRFSFAQSQEKLSDYIKSTDPDITLATLPAAYQHPLAFLKPLLEEMLSVSHESPQRPNEGKRLKTCL